MVDDALLPALNSNPSVGSNVMSSVDDFEDYDKSQYYDDIFAEEKEEEKGGGSFSSDSASSLVLGEEEERSEEEGESSAFTSSASILDDVVPASGDESGDERDRRRWGRDPSRWIKNDVLVQSGEENRDEQARSKVWHRFGEVWDASSSIKAGAIYGERIRQLAQESEGYVAEDEVDARRER